MLALLSPKLWAAIALAALLAATGFMGYRQGKASVRAEWNASKLAQADAQRELEKFRRQAADKAATGYEADKTAIRTKFVTITERVNVEIEKPVYRDVLLPASGLQILNDSIRATAGDSGVAGNTMPAASASH